MRRRRPTEAELGLPQAYIDARCSCGKKMKTDAAQRDRSARRHTERYHCSLCRERRYNIPARVAERSGLASVPTRGTALNYHTMWSPHRVRGPDGKARRRHGHEDPGRDLTLHVASTKALPVFTEQLWVVCCGSTGENRPKKRNWMKTGWRCRRRRPRARGRGVCHKHHPHVAEHYDRRTICAIPTMAPRTPPSRMRIHSSSLKIGCSRFSNLSGGILCKASLFLRSMSVICPM
mmetsp:Transcript_23129/g.61745  ORF Transcript_23129/g.61745 Transcript_23129/m.61745 type:complete len:234 (-) Transcript_23129:1134-1835(-)